MELNPPFKPEWGVADKTELATLLLALLYHK